jgi:hypothetical protein
VSIAEDWSCNSRCKIKVPTYSVAYGDQRPND